MATPHSVIARPYQAPSLKGAREDLRPVYLAVFLGYLLLLPSQFNVAIAGTVLPPYRLFLIPASLLVLSQVLRGRLRLAWPDIMIAGAIVWACISLIVTSEPIDALTSSVAITCDIAIAYFFARVAIVSVRSFRIMLILMAPGLAISGLIIVAESVTQSLLLQRATVAFIGTPFVGELAIRWGLLRAPGAFPQPILAGIFFASFFPLYLWSGLRKWPLWAGIAGSIAAFFTVSSAALLGLVVGLGLIIYDRITELKTQANWRLFMIVLGLVLFVAEFGTKTGLYGLIARFGSISSYNGFYRILIWRYGSENVAQNPWFGIGFTEWDRPQWMSDSIDHYWLLMAIQYGVIPPLLIALAIVFAVSSIALRSTTSPPLDRRTERSVAIALSVFAFSTISVSIWLSAQVWLFMLLGICVSLASASRRPTAYATRQPQPMRPRPNKSA